MKTFKKLIFVVRTKVVQVWVDQQELYDAYT